MSLQVVIFSKDRPMQLHGTLASFELHCSCASNVSIVVLYCASTDNFAFGYQQLQVEFAHLTRLTWIRELDFRRDLLRAVSGFYQAGTDDQASLFRSQKVLKSSQQRFVLFLVDDTLFIHPFSLSEITFALVHHPGALAFSLRLGSNTTHCYSRACSQPLPHFRPAGARVLQYRWLGSKGDFGYPLEVSSSVFRVDDLQPLLRCLPFANPNRLEQRLAASRLLFSFRHPDLLCYESSVAFCAPLNKVQIVLPNRSGQSSDYSSASLQSLFDQGVRIDVSALQNFVPHAAHQEIDLPLTRMSLG